MPSKLTPKSFWASTANSIGSSLNTILFRRLVFISGFCAACRAKPRPHPASRLGHPGTCTCRCAAFLSPIPHNAPSTARVVAKLRRNFPPDFPNFINCRVRLHRILLRPVRAVSPVAAHASRAACSPSECGPLCLRSPNARSSKSKDSRICKMTRAQDVPHHRGIARHDVASNINFNRVHHSLCHRQYFHSIHQAEFFGLLPMIAAR